MKFKATFTLVLLLTFFLVLLGWVYSLKILVLSGYILMILLNLLNIVFAIRRRFRRQSRQDNQGTAD